MKKYSFIAVIVLLVLLSVFVPPFYKVNAEEEPGKGVIFFNTNDGVSSATYTSINKGVPVELTAEIVNTGEATVKDLKVHARDLDDTIILQPKDLSLGPGEKKNVTFTFLADKEKEVKTGTYNFTLRVFSRSNESIEAFLPCKITITGGPPDKRADLYFIGGVEVSTDTLNEENMAKEGDVLTIIVKVGNKGGSPAQDVDVRFSVDGEVKKTNTLTSVNNDTKDVKTVIFSWVAEEGKHRFEFSLDPDNSVPEPNDQLNGNNNNELSKNITVLEKGREVVSPLTMGVIILTFMGTLVWFKKRSMRSLD